MPGRDPLSERLAASGRRPGFSVRDRKTQLTLASAAAALIVLVAVIALPGGGKKSSSRLGATGEESTSTLSETEGREVSPSTSGSTGSGPLTGVGGSRSSGSVGSDVTNGAETKKLPPITATTIKIGMTYNEDPGTANAAAGFGGIGQVDQKRGWDMVVKYLNKNPPMGRKVIPVFYHQTTAQIQSKGSEQMEQEACALFTKENRVFMVFDGALIGGGTTFHTCATKAGIPEIGGAVAPTRATYEKFKYLVSPTDTAFDRMAEYEVDQLFDGGFFSHFKKVPAGYLPLVPADKKPRVGLIRYDTPGHKSAAKTMKARLSSHGVALCDGCEWEVTYSSTNVQEQLDDSTEVNAAIQGAKAKGVTHMLFLGSTAGVRITLFFIQGAEQQKYRPRLGFNPEDAPTAVRDLLKEQSYGQFEDSMLITDNPGDFDQRTAAFKECKKMWEEAGEEFTGNSAANKEDQAPGWCNAAWYYSAAMTVAGRSLSLGTWMYGVENVPPVKSASVYLIRTKSGRHDGSGAVRQGLWADSCKCYKPISPIIPV
jgi:hypothetical protein